MKKQFLLATVAVAAMCGSAMAADVGPAPYDWTGLYVGINGGYAFGGNDEVLIGSSGGTGDLSLNGMFGGAQIGYNQQMNNIVLGLELDGQLADINDTDPLAEDQIDWFGTGRLRVGYAMDRMMVYATGGIALAGGTYNNIADKVVDDYTRAGLTVGGGLEFAVTDNVSIKGEYLYANFGRFTVGTTEATPDFHLVRAGLNFKF